MTRQAAHALAAPLPAALRPTAILLAALLLAALAGPAAAQWPPWTKTDDTPVVYPSILVPPDSLHSLGAVLLDARPPADYRRGHLPGAISAPADSLLTVAGLRSAEGDPAVPAQLTRALGELGVSGTELVVCYADRDSPEVAALLLWCLELAGHRDARVLNGGIDASADGLVAGASTRAPTPWRASPSPERLATPAWVRAHFGRPQPGLPDWELLDLRARATWLGEGSDDRAAERTGHIPQSHPLDPAELLDERGRMPAPERLREVLAALGPRPASPLRTEADLVAYGDGVTGTGALGYLAARAAGFPRVRWLPGGWAAWIDAGGPRTRVLSTVDVAALLERADPHRPVLVFDVRHSADWSAAHLPGAISLAPHVFADSLDSALARLLPAGAPRSAATLVAYCYGPSCVRSRNCTTLAAQAGLADLVWFRGGIEEWVAQGEPIVRERPPGAGASWWTSPSD